jgi:DNA-binding transcriptional LysR family regulator
MQIELVETFLDLCETRNFNRTADRLGVTQSTVSGRVRALEAALGARLFDRSRSGTALTTEGLRFEPHARSLRHGWTEALHATRSSGDGAMTLRIGIQHDLVGSHFSDLIRGFRAALPETAFFFEADYSAQMCSDLVSGNQDFAILFTPRTHPDIYFETVGEIAYVMVSTEVSELADVRLPSYILANFSPAFAHSHAALHPGLVAASLSIGQNAAMVGLLGSLGGTAYVLDTSADALVADGTCTRVTNAPVIPQTVFAGINVRQRHRAMYRRLVQVLRSGLFLQVPQLRPRVAAAPRP